MRSNLIFREIPYIKSISLVFLIYLLAIVISQFGRFSFTYKPFLDQGRWLLGFPVFIFLYQLRINFAKILDWGAPLCLGAAFISSVFVAPSQGWQWGERASVSFIDPLVFGFSCLTVALVCFSSSAVDLYRSNVSVNTAIKLLAFLLGVYLSIRSGSRSGWIALPIVIFMVFYVLYKPSMWRSIVLGAFAVASVALLYLMNDIVMQRIDEFLNDVLQYPWHGGVAPDSSVGSRITFNRLGAYYFSQSPLFGWGERGYGEIKDAVELQSFSSQAARDLAFSALFHSEWVTQSVRYGIFGLIAVIWVFGLPMRLFVKFVKRGPDFYKVGLMGMTFVICQIAASVSDEVFNHKSTVTFATFMIAGLLATGLSLSKLKDGRG